MRAVLVERFGAPDVMRFGERPAPRPGAGQVIIATAAASVGYIDTQIRLGRAGGLFDETPPYVPGNGVAGTVIQLGAGVPARWLGRPVVADTVGGGYAELTVAEEADLVAVPDGLSLPDAAALLHDGRTAVALLRRAGVRAGQRVLILPAAGGAGSVLVQLARAAGAHVTGAARGAVKLELARELGAHAAVDYSDAGWVAAAGAVDVVLDGVGGALGRAAFGALADGGRYSQYGAPSTDAQGIALATPIDAEQARSRGVTIDGMTQLRDFHRDRIGNAAAVLADAAAGRVRPLVGQTYPLSRAAEAHAAIEGRRFVGKSLLLT